MICRLIPTWWLEDLKGNVIDNVTDIDIVNVNGHSNVITRAMSMSLLGQAAATTQETKVVQTQSPYL